MPRGIPKSKNPELYANTGKKNGKPGRKPGRQAKDGVSTNSPTFSSASYSDLLSLSKIRLDVTSGNVQSFNQSLVMKLDQLIGIEVQNHIERLQPTKIAEKVTETVVENGQPAPAFNPPPVATVAQPRA